MKKAVVAIAGCAAALGLTPAAASAAAGDLDPSFAGDGELTLADPGAASKVLVQEDGKILVVGSGNGQANDFVVVRLNPDGSRDATWGEDGKAIADFGGLERANAAALQSDGKLVVAGETYSTSAPSGTAVARFDSRGRLDPTFDPGGADGDGKKFLSPLSGAVDDAVAVLVQPDAKIVLAGRAYGGDDYDLGVTRLTPTGAVDGTDWESGGFGASVNPYAAALTPDRKIVVAGTKHPDASPSEIALKRFDPDGKLDKGFGGTGRVTFASNENEEVTEVLVQPDGKVVVEGTATGDRPELVVTRFDRDGKPDSSWDGDGRAFAGFEGGSLGAAAALQPDGKVMVAGASVDGLDIAAARFNPTGTLDTSFGSGGRTTIPGGFIEIAYAVALQGDGRIILAGQSAAGAPVARLLGDPAQSGGGGAAPDSTAPVLTGLRLTPPRFPRGNRLPALKGARATRRSPQIRFTLSEPARVRFTFKRARHGRYRPVPGSFTVNARAGASRVRFHGRLTARRRLAPGRYRLIATPVDRAGNTGNARRAAFRLLAAKQRK
jgi:uncharacterized delta-60 repeat protein